jgi:hypothetical protein
MASYAMRWRLGTRRKGKCQGCRQERRGGEGRIAARARVRAGDAQVLVSAQRRLRVDAHAARRDRPCGRPRDGVQPQRLRRAALGRAGQERRGFNLQALRAGSAAREEANTAPGSTSGAGHRGRERPVPLSRRYPIRVSRKANQATGIANAPVTKSPQPEMWGNGPESLPARARRTNRTLPSRDHEAIC